MGVLSYLGKQALSGISLTAEGVGRGIAGVGRGAFSATKDYVAPATGWLVAKGVKAVVGEGRALIAGRNSTNPLVNPIGGIVSNVNKLSNKMLKYDKEGGIALSNTAKGMILGGGLIAGGVGGAASYRDTRIGKVDPNMYHAAPKIEPRQYSVDNAGADGSLVFALNANR